MKCSDANALLSLSPVPPLVLITGGCTYDREAIFPDLEISERFLADELTPKRLAAAFSNPSLFGQQTPYLIRGLANLDAASLKVLLAYSEDLVSPFRIVAEGQTAPAALVRLFEARGVHLDLGRLPPWEEEKAFVRWLHQESAGLLSLQLAAVMVERIGCDKWRLAAELEKLRCYTGSRRAVTQADLDLLLVGLGEHTVWELGRAVMGRDPERALHILSTMGEGMGLFGTLAALRSQMETGLMCVSLQDTRKIQQALPKLKGRQLDRTVALAKGYGEQGLRQAILRLGALERAAKRSALPEQIALEWVITELAVV